MSSSVPSPTWDCTKSPRWQALLDSARAGRKIRDLFATDSERFQKFSRSAGELMLDFSKNTIDDEALHNLLGLFKEADVEAYVFSNTLAKQI
jgi:glucose-6-phosphate isomerase